MAGAFYPADPGRCRAVAQALLQVPPGQPDIPHGWGGIVPHAGWICSGAIAGRTLGMLARGPAPDVVVVFGAVHTPIDIRTAALDSHATWAVPNGTHEIARDLAEQLARSSSRFITDDRFHAHEHAVEVELPLIHSVWPGSRLLPVEVPVVDDAPDIGRQTARVILDAGLRPVFLASSDLTHYGPAYDFTPAGVGIEALQWAKENDRRLLRLVENFEIDRVVPEARQHLNACGPGAIAAMLAACKESGATAARVLRHANSYQTLAEVAPQEPVDAVGYAAVVVTCSGKLSDRPTLPDGNMRPGPADQSHKVAVRLRRPGNRRNNTPAPYC
ncbi:MAG: AmmeMemoRadiSam system protein B, partial [Streptosporangiaceae bacterium]